MIPEKTAPKQLIEGKPALIVIDIQASTFSNQQGCSIPNMAGYADTMLKCRTAIDTARANNIPVIFIQEIHRANGIDFGRELDGSEEAHRASLNAMEYLQTGAVCSLAEALAAMKDNGTVT